MSAFGPKRTSVAASHMSALGGKADMACCGNSLSRSLLGVKRTWAVAPHMSAFDPKRTSCHGAKARISLGLSIVVNRPGATCSDAVEADKRPRGSARVDLRLDKRKPQKY